MVLATKDVTDVILRFWIGQNQTGSSNNRGYHRSCKGPFFVLIFWPFLRMTMVEIVDLLASYHNTLEALYAEMSYGSSEDENQEIKK
jgi:hypothetical protein